MAATVIPPHTLVPGAAGYATSDFHGVHAAPEVAARASSRGAHGQASAVSVSMRDATADMYAAAGAGRPPAIREDS